MTNSIRNSPILLCGTRPVNNNDSESQIEYILETAEVTEQQDLLCGKTGLSNTIIFQNKTGEKDRTDSRISSKSLRRSCDMIRRCDLAQESLCEFCDSEYASLLIGANANKIKSTMYNRINKVKQEFIENDIIFNNPEIHQIEDMYYIQYNCPMLGYIETMFPIRFESRVIALLILGQIKLDGEEEKIRSATERFIEKKKQMFLDYIGEVQKKKELKPAEKEKYSFEAIEKYMTCEDEKQSTHYIDLHDNYRPGMLIPALPESIDEREQNDILKQTYVWINDFEQRLHDRMSEKRSAKLKKYFDSEQINLFQEINKTQLEDHNMSFLWKKVSSSINNLRAECHLQSITMFSVSEGQELKRVSYTESSNIKSKPIVNKIEKMIPQLLELPSVPYDSISRDESILDANCNNTLSDLFSVFGDSEPFILLFLPRREIPEASIFVLLEKGTDEYTESIFPSLLSGLKNYIILLSAQVATIVKTNLQNQLDTAYRTFRHETWNLATDFKRASTTLLEIANGKEIDYGKLKNTANDANASLQLFYFLSGNFDNIIDEKAVKKKDFDIYDLIYKWESVRRRDLHDKSCEIIYEKQKVPVFCDPRFFEIIVYNLISNAVKYSFDETKIYVDCKRDTTNSNMILFTITNFSFGIPENEREYIFDSGYRCAVAKEYTPDGSGIGLYLCKRAAALFGGDVILKEHNKVSNYNVPMLKKLIENSDYYDIVSPEDLKLCQKAYDDLRLRKNEWYGEELDYIDYIVSDWRFNKPSTKAQKRRIRDLLKTPTYSVKFEVWIYG